jgi:hypothetical protein
VCGDEGGFDGSWEAEGGAVVWSGLAGALGVFAAGSTTASGLSVSAARDGSAPRVRRGFFSPGSGDRSVSCHGALSGEIGLTTFSGSGGFSSVPANPTTQAPTSTAKTAVATPRSIQVLLMSDPIRPELRQRS